ncbi:MAG: ATP-binding cassette domain-containing protein [Ilumatobacteraceae bacterium]
MSAAIVTGVGVGRTIESDGRSLTLLRPTDFELVAGRLVALAGPSGSGKTTLCSILIGWDRATEGTITWAEDAGDPGAPSGSGGWARRSLAPQRLALFATLTLGENIALPLLAAGRREDVEPAVHAVAESLDILGLLHRLPHEVSFGEQQRAAIARALVGRPALAILDEPTGHQDAERTALVVEALLALRTSGSCSGGHPRRPRDRGGRRGDPARSDLGVRRVAGASERSSVLDRADAGV